MRASGLALRIRGCGNREVEQSIHQGVSKVLPRGIRLESGAIAGDSPVLDRQGPPHGIPSSAGHVEPGVNLGGPPPKAKYYPATDSAQVA